ncbi:hypothetical protein [Mycobacteroides abscessus]|uniref:hypothetical protein n=1 Tax=Mycobacteroides abscessus TaxID=36809 RepID=UPI00092C1DB3|nr:hypothetical protein [Mycobacteroides abscessus]SHO82622.1 Uncharacterised protein [Mycobacteroides abscessus subsp. abscessus]SHP59523.1 Uncharacterised protein [Mycobacteroides abscessus subsp. abscessus]SHP82641.1 Uncharacterised protein [Mycobacteroides abscessus subsp. abscessus]SHP94312.1 Uncharacterised protein [Mycobacteroides abscessus subsp. abscessus]SHQ50651.1 Uncharacterised protein [Mycobacteroides abscessus subsp. abscessus]
MSLGVIYLVEEAAGGDVRLHRFDTPFDVDEILVTLQTGDDLEPFEDARKQIEAFLVDAKDQRSAELARKGVNAVSLYRPL